MAFTSNLLLLFPIATLAFVAMRLANVAVDSRRFNLGVEVLRLTILILFCLSLVGLGARVSLGAIVWFLIAAFVTLAYIIKDVRLRRSMVARGLSFQDDPRSAERLAGLYSEAFKGGISRRAQRVASLMKMGVTRSSAMESVGLSGNLFATMSLRLRDKFGIRVQQQSLIDPWQLERDLERAIGQLSLVILPLPLIPLALAFFWRTQSNVIRLLTSLNERKSSRPSTLFDSIPYGTAIVASTVLLIILALTLTLMGLFWLSPRLAQLPPWRWFFARYFQCVGLVGFAQILTKYKALDQAIEYTASVVPVPHIAARYFRAGQLLRQGHSIEASFRMANLCSTAGANVLAKATSSDLHWAAEEVARQSYIDLLDRCRWFVVGLSIGLTLLAATPIGLLAIAVIQFLVLLPQQVNY